MSFPRYGAYRGIDGEQRDEAPAHWQVKRLRFVVDLNPSKSEVASYLPDTEVSFLPMEAIGEDGTVDLAGTRQLNEVLSGYTYLRDGDVVLAKITPCFENGKGAVLSGLKNGFGFGTTELIVARPKLPQCSAEFIHWLFVSKLFRKQGEAAMYGAGGQKRVPDAFVRDFLAAIPPLAEQAAITAFLDRETGKIDALVEEQKRLIDLLKEKRQAVISHAVTKGLNPDAPMKDSGVEALGQVPGHWITTRLKFYAHIKGRIGFRGYTVEDLVAEGEGAIALGGANIGEHGRLSLDSKTFLNWTKYEESPEIKIEMLDVLIGQRGTCGKAAIVNLDIGPATINPSLVVVKDVSLEIEKIFLCLWINSGPIQIIFKSYLNKTAVPMLSQEQIANIPLFIPPKIEQERIVEFITSTTLQFDRLILEAERSAILLQERRAALISAAVIGKIDIRGPVTDDAQTPAAPPILETVDA